MKRIILFLILFCLAGLANAQTSQNDEPTRLSAEAVKLFSEKKYKEALPVAEKVVRLREQQSGANDLKTGQALRNLGFIQQANGDKKEAEKTLDKAIAIYEASPGLTKEYQTQLAQMLEITTFMKVENGKAEKAVELYQKAAELGEKIHGKDALEITDSLWALANIYQIGKDYKNAEKLYRRVLEIRAQKLPRSSWDTQDAKNHYYCMAARNDNLADAESIINSLSTNNQNEPQNQLLLRPNSINGGVINGKATYLAKPSYPMEARSARASGTVSIQVTISEEGKVIFACAMSGNKLLYDVSEYAAYQSTFQPIILSGKPIKVTGYVIYNFVP